MVILNLKLFLFDSVCKDVLVESVSYPFKAGATSRVARRPWEGQWEIKKRQDTKEKGNQSGGVVLWWGGSNSPVQSVSLFIHSKKEKSAWWGQRHKTSVFGWVHRKWNTLRAICAAVNREKHQGVRHLLIHPWARGQLVYMVAPGIPCSWKWLCSSPKECPSLWSSHG